MQHQRAISSRFRLGPPAHPRHQRGGIPVSWLRGTGRGLFSSAYFNSLVRFSFALVLVATVVYLISKEKSYAHSFNSAVSELETDMEELKGGLGGVSLPCKVSRMVVTSGRPNTTNWSSAFPAGRTAGRGYPIMPRRRPAGWIWTTDASRPIVEKGGRTWTSACLSLGDGFRPEAAELTPREKDMIRRRHPLISAEVLASVRPSWGDPSPWCAITTVVERHGLPGRLEGGGHPPGRPASCFWPMLLWP